MVVYKNKRKVLKKTYKKKTTTKPMANIVKREIAKVMNRTLEKKNFTITYSATDQVMGQVAGNSNGFYSADVTPTPALGSSSGGRIGNDINVTGMYMTVQLRQMSAATAPVKITWYIMRMKGDYSSTSGQVVANSFNTNDYIGGGAIIYDTQSSLNSDFFGTYTILKKFNCYIKPDQFTGQQMPCVKNIALKFRKPLNVRFYSNGTGVCLGKIFLVALASNGNCSTVTASTITNLPVSAVNTGQFLNFSMKYYYTDA